MLHNHIFNQIVNTRNSTQLPGLTGSTRVPDWYSMLDIAKFKSQFGPLIYF